MSSPSDEEGKSSNPKGLATVDNQGESETCVRFAVAKAVANSLFRSKIDIKQSHIMVALVQEHKQLYPINPVKFDNTVLYLQDKENQIDGYKNKSWWKIKVLVDDKTDSVKGSGYNEDNEYILGYSMSKLGQKIQKSACEYHCVYVRRKYRSLSSRHYEEDVFECLNSWGFDDPSLTIPASSKAITRNLNKHHMGSAEYDQGQWPHCTLFAISLAISEACGRHGIKLEDKLVRKYLMQNDKIGRKDKIKSGWYPEDFHEVTFVHDTPDFIWLTIRVEKMRTIEYYKRENQFVLVALKFLGDDDHCMFVMTDYEECFLCRNSDLKAATVLPVRKDRSGNTLHRITVPVTDKLPCPC